MPELASGAKEVFYPPVRKNRQPQKIEAPETLQKVWRVDFQDRTVPQRGAHGAEPLIPRPSRQKNSPLDRWIRRAVGVFSVRGFQSENTCEKNYFSVKRVSGAAEDIA